MEDLDALLADLESTTSHISKRPVFLPDETPYSIPTGGNSFQEDVSLPPPVPPPPSAEALNGSVIDPLGSLHSSQQSLGSAQKSSWSQDSNSPTLSHIEEDHVYSFPNKQKSSDSSASAMNSALGSNLSELDRLLLELNAVQQNSPSFPTTEEAAPPLPSCSITHYENGVGPSSQDKPKRNGTRGGEEGRPTVESLLDELEGSVPTTSPSPSVLHSELDTPSQQQARISASCATRELDELMASLSDFKLKSVIRRTKETPNVHPMYRDGLLRRKMGPIIVNKSSSQDRLIEELQGKLGIGRAERRRKQPDDWLTEGVIVMSKPQRFRPEGAGVEVDKIIIPPESPVPQRKIILPPPSPPAPRRPPPVEERTPPPPVKQAPLPVPPPPPPPPPTPPPQPPQEPIPAPPPQPKPQPVPVQRPPSPKPEPPRPVPQAPPPQPPPVELPPPPPPKVLVSVGCQTEYDPIFPPMQIMAQGKGGAPGGPPTQVNKLDNMLGSLQSDLHKLGVQTVAKGVCGACCKPIVGQVVTAMGRTWHPEHFVCTHCQEEIGSRNFFERDGQPYCEKDYHNLFSPRCYYCNGPILDKVVTALDRTWHPEHFFCAQCGSFFGPEGFHEKDGKAYCRKDYFDMFAPKCGGCARAILENYISALNSLWHPECFVCRECFTPFVNGSFFEHDGQPYCEVHYHERRGSLCSGCQKPITGRCITAMAKKFHPEHFVCAFCLKQLNKGTFKEQNDKPYCQGCFVKLFS
ncbi:paxillin isoform X2 [Hypomesus transpacificus]|uniref:paxillin isoform X2 n=1 Tax=Hypomesus transpacificus TaxID=137520 RepID=UPI001F0734FC|nr:paxillin isoform X2 [Hypomesus transpacificus]